VKVYVNKVKKNDFDGIFKKTRMKEGIRTRFYEVLC